MPTPTTSRTTAPRLLVLTADHGPATTVVSHAAERLWPGVHLTVHSVRLPPAARGRTGITAVRLTRPLGRVIDSVRPDLVLSTHTVLTAGLDRLRRSHGLAVPVTTWCPGNNTEDDTGYDTEDIEDTLRRLARTAPRPGPRRLRAPDALFAHLDSPAVPQHVGAVLVFDPGPPLTAEHAATMLAAVPGVLGHLTPATLIRPTRWVPSPARSAQSLVDTTVNADLDDAVDTFFATPLTARRTVGAARLVTGLPDGRRALLVKLHHALGDGMTVSQALLSDTDDAATLSWAARPATPVGPSAFAAPRPGPRILARGLRQLATAGRAPAAYTDGPVHDARRHHARALLPGRALRAGARAFGVSPAALLLATFAQAWYDVGREHGHEATKVFRLMVPWSQRGIDSLHLAGNRTGAVSVDLPVGPTDLRERASTVAEILRSRTESGVPGVANLVVHAIGALPPPLHRAVARAMYRGTWFNAVGTVMPGPRRDVHWHGSRMSAAYPVLPLAPGTGLAWGALTWGPWITVCVTTTTTLHPLGPALADRMADLVTGLTP